MKAVIGITTSNTIQDNRFFISHDYLCAICDNGGVPILLPPCPLEDIDKQLDSIDGLLLSGGGDINPLLLGEEPHPNLREGNLLRDRYELALAKAAIKRRMPILGICRGLQVIAAVSGGSLIQDICHSAASICHDQKSPRYDESHSIDIIENTILHQIFGTTNTTVNSFHHQAVSHASDQLIISAKSKDGIIEAMEGQKGFILGVQWHAENLCQHNPLQKNLFVRFIHEANIHAKERDA